MYSSVLTKYITKEAVDTPVVDPQDVKNVKSTAGAVSDVANATGAARDYVGYVTKPINLARPVADKIVRGIPDTNASYEHLRKLFTEPFKESRGVRAPSLASLKPFAASKYTSLPNMVVGESAALAKAAPVAGKKLLSPVANLWRKVTPALSKAAPYAKRVGRVAGPVAITAGGVLNAADSYLNAGRVMEGAEESVSPEAHDAYIDSSVGSQYRKGGKFESAKNPKLNINDIKTHHHNKFNEYQKQRAAAGNPVTPEETREFLAGVDQKAEDTKAKMTNWDDTLRGVSLASSPIAMPVGAIGDTAGTIKDMYLHGQRKGKKMPTSSFMLMNAYNKIKALNKRTDNASGAGDKVRATVDNLTEHPIYGTGALASSIVKRLMGIK